MFLAYQEKVLSSNAASVKSWFINLIYLHHCFVYVRSLRDTDQNSLAVGASEEMDPAALPSSLYPTPPSPPTKEQLNPRKPSFHWRDRFTFIRTNSLSPKDTHPCTVQALTLNFGRQMPESCTLVWEPQVAISSPVCLPRVKMQNLDPQEPPPKCKLLWKRLLSSHQGPQQVTNHSSNQAGQPRACPSSTCGLASAPLGLNLFSLEKLKHKLDNGEWLASEDFISFSCTGSPKAAWGRPEKLLLLLPLCSLPWCSILLP